MALRACAPAKPSRLGGAHAHEVDPPPLNNRGTRRITYRGNGPSRERRCVGAPHNPRPGAHRSGEVGPGPEHLGRVRGGARIARRPNVTSSDRSTIHEWRSIRFRLLACTHDASLTPPCVWALGTCRWADEIKKTAHPGSRVLYRSCACLAAVGTRRSGTAHMFAPRPGIGIAVQCAVTRYLATRPVTCKRSNTSGHAIWVWVIFFLMPLGSSQRTVLYWGPTWGAHRT